MLLDRGHLCLGHIHRIRYSPRLPSKILLLDVFLFNMFHHFPTLCEVGLQAMRQSLGNFDELIVNHRAPGNLSARWNHMSAPLKDESKIPQGKKRKHEALLSIGKPERAEKAANSLQQKRQSKNKYGSQRNKKTIPVR